MLNTPKARRGMVTAPHHLAAQAGLAVLRDGGNAAEAAIAIGATLAVIYPHMNGLGGDAFWILHDPELSLPVTIDACGAAGSLARPQAYAGMDRVPRHGPLAANTVPGLVSSWQAGMEVARRWGGRLPQSRLFADALHYASQGFAVTAHQAQCAAKLGDLLPPEFQVQGEMRQPALAQTLECLIEQGFDSFYRGEVGRGIAAELRDAGCPVTAEDFARHRSIRRRPLQVDLRRGTAFNLMPPTVGLASLMILGLFDRLRVERAEGFAHVHGVVEATKQAFLLRDRYITDPSYMPVHAQTWLAPHVLDQIAARISMTEALPWPQAGETGDTVWFAAADSEGRMVSAIQSLYQPFGSGVFLRKSGLLLHNRGVAFDLDPQGVNFLRPGRKPRHTLNPALAKLKDGRILAYGSMGGEAQPQVQAAVFTRYADFGQDLQRAVTAPRWALGRGRRQSELLVENRLDVGLIEALLRAGHDVRVAGDFDSAMGHAGAIAQRPEGYFEGAADPRSDGSVAAW